MQEIISASYGFMPKDKKKVLVLLDMHAILHRAFHALPAFSSPKGEPTGALYGFAAFLLKILKELKPDYIAAACDLPEPTFRHAVYEKYKGERPETASELVSQIKRSYDILKAFSIPAFEHPRFEADDILGTIVEKASDKKDLEVIIASGDLDTLQLADRSRVKVFTLRKGISDTVIYDEKKVRERYGFSPKLLPDYKGLKGDSSDNIIGVPGIGDKGASELIQKFGSLEKILKTLKKNRAALLKAGIKERTLKLLEEHEEEALFSKELGSIRRDVPIEFKLEKFPWHKNYDKEKVSLLFKELGFMSLLSRLPIFGETSKKAGEGLFAESGAEFLKKENKIFWFEEGEKLYAAGENRKVAVLDLGDSGLTRELFGVKARHYFFDSKKIFHKLSSLNIPLQIDFDLKIAAWLSRPTLQNPSLADVLHNFLPKEEFQAGESLTMASLMPSLASTLEQELQDKKLSKVFKEIELPLIPVLFEMEEKGILIDGKFLKKLSLAYEKELTGLQKKIWKSSGAEFNVNSPRQLAEVLFEKLKLTKKGLKKTGKGSLSTRFSELFKLKESHPIIKDILAYRELAKIKSTYLDTLPELLDEAGRVHTTFDETGTVTGRLSSFNPNLQNIPIRSKAGREMRKAFLATPGFELAAFDYSQLELRIAAILSGDKKMIKAFKEGKDIHAATASEIFNVPEDKITDEMRREAKVINFGILYGMGIKALAQSLEMPREKAEAFWREYFRDFEGVYQFLEKTKERAREKGYVETIFGRRRYLPEIYSQAEYIQKEAERMAINAPIQGTEADIVKLGMTRSQEAIHKKFKGEAFQLLQIHDEILFEVKKSRVLEFIPEIKNILEGIYPHEVKLAVEIKTGPNWGEMKKYAILR